MREEIDAVVREMFAAFGSDAAAAGSLERLPSLFTADARVTVLAAGAATTYSVDEFIAPRRALLLGASLTAFSEWETEAETLLGQDIATRRSRYAKRGVRDGVAFTGAGTKMLAFMRVGGAWKIHSLLWQDDEA